MFFFLFYGIHDESGVKHHKPSLAIYCFVFLSSLKPLFAECNEKKVVTALMVYKCLDMYIFTCIP
jgi:hypothetical protein